MNIEKLSPYYMLTAFITFALLQRMTVTLTDATPFETIGESVWVNVITLGRRTLVIAGVLATTVGGCMAAWRATKGEDFTRPLLFAIVGFTIAAAANQFADRTFWSIGW